MKEEMKEKMMEVRYSVMDISEENLLVCGHISREYVQASYS